MSLSIRSSLSSNLTRFGQHGGVAPALATQKVEALSLPPVSSPTRVYELLRKKEALPTMDARMILGVSEEATLPEIQAAYDGLSNLLQKALEKETYPDSRIAKEEVLEAVQQAYKQLNPNAVIEENSSTIQEAKKKLGIENDEKVTPNLLKARYQHADRKAGLAVPFQTLYSLVAPQIAGLNIRESNAATPSSNPKTEIVEMLRLPSNSSLQMVQSAHQSIHNYYKNSIQALQDRIQKMKKASNTLQKAYDTYEPQFFPNRSWSWLPVVSKKPIESVQ